MIETNIKEYEEKCPLCLRSYTQEITKTEKPDWHGRIESITTTSKKYDKCPHCEDDVIRAAELLKEIKKYREEKLDRLIQKYRENNLYLINYIKQGNSYEYLNISNREYKRGHYFYFKDNEYKIVYLRPKEKPPVDIDLLFESGDLGEVDEEIEKVNNFLELYKTPNLVKIKFNKEKLRDKAKDAMDNYESKNWFHCLKEINDNGYIEDIDSLYFNHFYNSILDIIKEEKDCFEVVEEWGEF